MCQTQVAETASASALLDAALTRIRGGEVFDGMDELVAGLDAVRRSSTAGQWRDVCKAEVRTHELFFLMQQSPFTRRAFAKPRGYPGDAVTIDYIYGLQPLGPCVSQQVRDLYACEFRSASCRSVRARRTLLAGQIDLAGARSRRPRILSMACGHLREARDATLLLDQGAGAFFAVDQDPTSLAVVGAELELFGVAPVHGSVRGVLAGKVAYANLDLVYAAGLYDYLGDPLAIQLTARLFAMLRPGGRLLVPNFNASLRDVSYLEAFMDWWLVYRDDADMTRLMSAIPERDVAAARLFRDAPGNITVLEMTRR